MEDLLLMLGNNFVVRFNISSYEYQILNPSLVPFAIRNVINSPAFVSALMDWFKGRAIQVSRVNRDKILKASGFSGGNDIYTLLIRYRALSLLDNYWVRGIDEQISYADVNLYQNSFSKVMFDIALLGAEDLTISDATPEVNQRGCMAKAFKRESDSIYLYKTGSMDKIRAEVFASNVAQYCGMSSVIYKQVTTAHHVCVKCKLETSPSIGWLHARDVIQGGVSPVDLAIQLSSYQYHEMRVFDFITGNIDRHNENWAFEFDNMNTILGLSKLYDFDNCFAADSNTVSQIDMQPLKLAALDSYNCLKSPYFGRLKGYLRSQLKTSNSGFANYVLDKVLYLEPDN